MRAFDGTDWFEISWMEGAPVPVTNDHVQMEIERRLNDAGSDEERESLADYVLGVWRDADDVEHVQLYELIKS